MSRNLMFLASTILVLTLTMSGASFAGSISPTDAVDTALYGQPDPFATVETAAGDHRQGSTSDQRVQEALQQASMSQSPGFGWEQSVPTARDARDHEDLYDPE